MIAADANDPRGIVWIASYPKSGNTWIRLFLHHLLLARRGQAPEAREIDRIATTTPGINRQVAFFEKAMGKPAQRDLSQGLAVEASDQFDESEVAESTMESVDDESEDETE